MRSDLSREPKGGETSEPGRRMEGLVGREEVLLDSELLPGSFEAIQISNTALATSLA